ncbi:MAG TPA: YitT family protein [Kouleothrix sp.]|uniref:YitT family protein n=1 Tax=Kouleothrix sp. TaxID=2779161 RepID=UPI002CD89E87|nr:YitT family protein [Kouleothrix sp.]HRC76271.1 YitT family protein [Kouleothrix sp.]
MPAPARRAPFNWGSALDYLLIIVSAMVSAVNVALFLAPHRIAPGGVSGMAILINAVTGWSISLVMLGFNVPLLALGFRMLGGWRFLRRSLIYTIISSGGVDVAARFFPATGISHDLLLNAIYAGVVGGISAGLLYRGGGAGASTGIISRVLQRLTGMPLSQAYLCVDGGIILVAALLFSWEAALYALITLFIWGVVADYVLEGPGVVRIATIVTDRGDRVADAIMHHLGYGVTAWRGEGKYTHQAHDVLFTTINRSQVSELRALVAAADPDALLVIGQGHQALGHRFRPLRPRFASLQLDLGTDEAAEGDAR